MGANGTLAEGKILERPLPPLVLFRFGLVIRLFAGMRRGIRIGRQKSYRSIFTIKNFI